MKFCDEKIQKHLLNGGKIERKSDNSLLFLNNNNGILYYQCDYYAHAYCINKQDLTVDDWKIVEPEYDWDKIIKDKVLCVFSNNVYFKCFSISTLISVDKSDEITYYSNEGFLYKYCKPFNPAEYNIAKNLKDYEK